MGGSNANFSVACPTCRNGICPRINSTPLFPEPPETLVHQAMIALPEIFSGKVDPNSHAGRIEVCAGRLVTWICERGHGKPAAHWGIHRLLLKGWLTAHTLPASLPNSYNVKTKTWLFPSGDLYVALPKNGPAPYSDFMVRATEELWAWWREMSQTTTNETKPPREQPPANTETVEPKATPKRRRNAAKQPSLEARALAVLTDHPEWSDDEIANVAGCNRTSLYRLPKYTAARALLKNEGKDNALRGVKNEAGLDAWETKNK